MCKFNEKKSISCPCIKKFCNFALSKDGLIYAL